MYPKVVDTLTFFISNAITKAMITFLLYKLLKKYLKKNNISAIQFRQYLKNAAKSFTTHHPMPSAT